MMALWSMTAKIKMDAKIEMDLVMMDRAFEIESLPGWPIEQSSLAEPIQSENSLAIVLPELRVR